eukprot:m.294589 g.294589  ORF g.294589 m.294589 type:complete len:324 (+) comp40751_c1_seq2:1282-2253(+)
MGVAQTKEVVKERFWWPGYVLDVEEWISSCEPCARRKEPVGLHSKKQATTEETPVELVHGEEGELPVSTKMEREDEEAWPTTDRNGREMKRGLAVMGDVVEKRTKDARVKRQENDRKSTSRPMFEKGEWVLLHSSPEGKKGKSKKLANQFREPFLVLENVVGDSMKIRMGEKAKRVHTSRLEEYCRRSGMLVDKVVDDGASRDGKREPDSGRSSALKNCRSGTDCGCEQKQGGRFVVRLEEEFVGRRAAEEGVDQRPGVVMEAGTGQFVGGDNGPHVEGRHWRTARRSTYIADYDLERGSNGGDAEDDSEDDDVSDEDSEVGK